MRARVLLAVVAVALAVVPFAPPTVSGDDDDGGRQLVITERMHLTSFNPVTREGTQEGTFVAAGEVNDAGSATAAFKVRPGQGGCGVWAGRHTLTSSAGTITVSTNAAICPFPLPTPARAFARGDWRVLSGTGVYSGLRGRGKALATADFATGQITIARDGKVKRKDCDVDDDDCAPGCVPVAEICGNGLDDDCDGLVDEDCVVCVDADGDGFFGSAGCGTPVDCQDGDAAVNPGAAEVCGNGLDDNCNGAIDEDIDADGDGWTACSGDCHDGNTSVNPGAFEFAGNGLDDDCDAATLDTGASACSAAAKSIGVTGIDFAAALGICQTTTENPPLAEKKWGLIRAQQLLANGSVPNQATLGNLQNFQTAILADYGTGGVVPTEGLTMAGLSNGRMKDQNDTGYVAPNTGSVFGSASNPPAVYLDAHGGALPGSHGCSGNCPSGFGANDSANVRLRLRVPTNAQSLTYQYRFFSAEYWQWTCTAFNDFHLALLKSNAPGIPADTNIAFDALGNPMSVNNGFLDICQVRGCNACPGGTGPLAGTGMQIDVFTAGFGTGKTGAGTAWLTVTAPVVPGEIIELDLMIFDVGDQTLDSHVLFDNFRWVPRQP